jgi:lysine-specific demethylase 8
MTETLIEHAEIPRLAAASEPGAIHELLRTESPFVVTDEVTLWPAFRRWSIDALSADHPQRRVTVNALPRGAFTAHDIRLLSMTLKEFFETFGREGSDTIYRIVQPLLNTFPWVASDVRPPSFIEVERIRQCGVWVDPAGVRTHLHWDSIPGFLGVVTGAKRVMLFSPDQYEALYPCHINWKQLNTISWSYVDVESPDLQRFPRYAHARGHTVDVAAGEMLFIPKNWWHAVFNDAALTIGVNFWLFPDPQDEQDVPPAGQFDFYRDRRLIVKAQARSAPRSES